MQERMSVTYDSDSDNSHSSSSSSDSATSYQPGSNVLLSPPPSTSVGGDNPLRRMRASSFSSPILNARSRSASISSITSLTLTSHIPPDADTPSDRPSSNQRNRSNPRNRTPRRCVTPVLGPTNRSTIAADDERERERRSNSNSSAGTAPRPRSRPGSTNRSAPNQHVVGLGAGLAVGTVLRPSAHALSSLREHRSEYRNIGPTGRSNKQGPGQRKVRRWNNDKFIGIASDISLSNPARGTMIANIYAEAEMNKGKYIMPNFPRNNRTIFSTLLSAKASDSVEDGGVEEDYGDGTRLGYGMEEDDDDEIHKVKLDPRRVAELRDRFVDGEVAQVSPPCMSKGAKRRLMERHQALFRDGNQMMKKNVNPRLLNVVMRTCQASMFTKRVVDAFERLLVQNMCLEEKEEKIAKDACTCSSDKEALVQGDAKLWKIVLTQKPLITRKKSQRSAESSGVTIRLLFDDQESKSAFHRLLFHAVSQFHGLETSSVTTSKGHRVLTVSGGCNGANIRFLDYLPCEEVEKTELEDIHESTAAVATASTANDENASNQRILENITGLKVR